MRVLIVADMEGVSGIEALEECAPWHPAYRRGADLLAAEVDALAGAAYAAGATRVAVIDWHGGGGNLRAEALDPRVAVVPEDLAPGYDVAFLTGFHAMAGTPRAFISHTMTAGLALEIDGEPAGELALLSRWLGEHGIPIALAAGDRAATLEAETALPDTPTLTVKRALSWATAESLPPERAHEALRAEVARVLGRPDRWRAYRPERPVCFRLRLRSGGDLAARLPWLEREDGGWLRGEVGSTRALIDLIDVLAALMAGERRAALLARLAADAACAPALETARLADLERSKVENPWP